MNMEYIRDHYSVPAKRGMRILMTPSKGRVCGATIVASRGAYIRVRLDGEEKIKTYHPTAEVLCYDCDEDYIRRMSENGDE